MVSESRLQELRQKFHSEVVKHVTEVTALLSKLDASWDPKAAEGIADHLHAVKGSAPIMAAHPISHVARVAEECMHHLMKTPSEFNPRISAALRESFTVMGKQADEFQAGREVPDGKSAIAGIRAAVPSLRTDDDAKTLAGKGLSAILGGAPEPAASSQSALRILFVDDSQIAREVYKILLSKKGYRVDVASDGTEALEKLRGGSYDAVVTDDQMPEMNGIELLRTTRGEDSLKSIPFVLISGKANDEAREAAMTAGAAAYLVKGDFQKEHLLEVLEQVLPS